MDYQSNSHKSKKKKNDEDDKKELEPIKLEGDILTRKKPLVEKIKGIFFGGEFKSAAQYIGAEVLLPAFRNLLVDATSKGIERIVYGDSTYTNRHRHPNYAPRTTYNRPVNRGQRRELGRPNLPDQPNRPRIRPGYTEIILANRSDAEMVLERLIDIIDRYQVVSVADLNELLGLPTTFVDNDWGWSEPIRYVEIRQIREGFLLDLPDPYPI